MIDRRSWLRRRCVEAKCRLLCRPDDARIVLRTVSYGTADSGAVDVARRVWLSKGASRRADERAMGKTTVDVRIGSDHFHFERDTRTGITSYFLNNLAVTVTDYLARMQHYREIELQRLFGRPH